MKKRIFWSALFLMTVSVGIGHTVIFKSDEKKIEWQVYHTQSDINVGQHDKGDIYRVKGKISSFLVEDMDASVEFQHILTTRDRHSIDLVASGVDATRLKNFVRGKPVEVFFKSIKNRRDFLVPLGKEMTSGSSLKKGFIVKIRQNKKWMHQKKKKAMLFRQQNEQNFFYDKVRTVNVGFISINIQGREGNTTITQDTLNAFTEHVEAMTYGKIQINTGMEKVHHINRSNTPLLDCRNPANIIAWSYERVFPPTHGLAGGGYNRVFIIYPFGENDHCNWVGITNLTDFNTNEYAAVTGSGNIIIRAGEDRVMEMLHEFGHTMGMRHSAMDINNDGVISQEEEFADPECGMARTPLAYNPIHMHKSIFWKHDWDNGLGTFTRNSPLLGIGYGLVSAEDGKKYQLASPLAADPLGKSIIHPHPVFSTNGDLPRILKGETVALVVRDKYYISRSIRDEDFVYIRQYVSPDSSQSYDSLVVNKIRVGSRFLFPDEEGDGICIIGENTGNIRLYVAYHASMADDHVCASPGEAESVVGSVVPSSVELVGSVSLVTTNKTPTVRVGGVRNGDLVEVYKDEDCIQKVGFGVSPGSSVDIKVSKLLPPGYYEFYAKAGAAASGMSACSTAHARYGVIWSPTPAVMTLVDPVASPDMNNTPTVRIEGGGVQNQDVLRLYTDSDCQNEASYPVVAKGGIVDIKTYRLTEGETHRFYVRYTRPGTNRSKCWDSGMDYTVTVDPGREAYRAPTIDMPGNGYLLPRYPDFEGDEWDDAVFSRNTGRVVEPVFENQVFLNRPMFSGARAALYTDPECKNEVASTPVASPVWYPDGNLDRTSTLRVVALGRTVNLKSPPLEPGVHTFYSKTWQNGKDGTVDAEFSECTSWGYAYTLLTPLVNPPVVVRPSAPTAIRVINPTGASAHRYSMPTFRVEGVQLGDVVTLHEDSECLLRLDNSWNKTTVTQDRNFVNIQSLGLNVGKYNVHARVTRNGVQSDCSTVVAPYERLAPIPPMISTLTISEPSGESSGTDTTPTIKVDHVEIGSMVGIYTDSACTTQVGSVESMDWSREVEVTTDSLSLGSHTFYTKVLRDGRESDCSTESVSYEVIAGEDIGNGVRPDAPAGLRLIKPKKSRSKKRRPLIAVQGVQTSDIVRIFSDSQCTQRVGGGTVLKKGSINIRIKKLTPGSYTFHANTTRNGMESDCSTASVDYTVLAK